MLTSAVQVVEPRGAQHEGQARASRETQAREVDNLGGPRASHLVDLR